MKCFDDHEVTYSSPIINRILVLHVTLQFMSSEFTFVWEHGGRFLNFLFYQCSRLSVINVYRDSKWFYLGWCYLKCCQTTNLHSRKVLNQNNLSHISHCSFSLLFTLAEKDLNCVQVMLFCFFFGFFVFFFFFFLHIIIIIMCTCWALYPSLRLVSPRFTMR